PQIALVTLPRGVPQLAVHPGDAGDKAVGFDRAKDLSGVWIDLMDLPVAILSDPECPFGPCEPRVASAAGCWNGREHTAGLRIDLLDPILGQLKQVRAVEGRSRMRGDVNRAQHLSVDRVEGVQRVTGGKPDMLSVIRHAMYVVQARKRSILAHDLGRAGARRSSHGSSLVNRQRSRE